MKCIKVKSVSGNGWTTAHPETREGKQKSGSYVIAVHHIPDDVTFAEILRRVSLTAFDYRHQHRIHYDTLEK